MFLGATNASAVQSVVAIERTVFYRERAAGMYSELPYAFAQVSHKLFINMLHLSDKNWHFSSCSSIAVWFWKFGFLWSAGGYRDCICCNTDFYLFSSLVFYDWIPTDSRKVLLFLLLHIHVFHLLLNVWHDGCCFNTWLSNCCHCHVLLPQLLELILWFSCSSPGKPTLNQTISNHFLTL